MKTESTVDHCFLHSSNEYRRVSSVSNTIRYAGDSSMTVSPYSTATFGLASMALQSLVLRETTSADPPFLDNLTDEFREYAEGQSSNDISEQIYTWGGGLLLVLALTLLGVLCIQRRRVRHQRLRRENVRDYPDQGIPLQQFGMPYRLEGNYGWGTGPLGVQNDEPLPSRPQVPPEAPSLPPTYGEGEGNSGNATNQPDGSSRTRSSFSTSVEPRQRQLRARDILRLGPFDRTIDGVIDEAESSHASSSRRMSTTQDQRQSSPGKEQSLTRDESRLQSTYAADSNPRHEQSSINRDEAQRNRNQQQPSAATVLEQPDDSTGNSSHLSGIAETTSYDGNVDWPSSSNHQPNQTGHGLQMDLHDVRAEWPASTDDSSHSEESGDLVRQNTASNRSLQSDGHGINLCEEIASSQGDEVVHKPSSVLDESQSRTGDRYSPSHQSDQLESSAAPNTDLQDPEEDSDAEELEFAVNMSLQAGIDSEPVASSASLAQVTPLSKYGNS